MNGVEGTEEYIKVVQAGRNRSSLRLKVMGPQCRSVKACQIESRDRNGWIKDEIFRFVLAAFRLKHKLCL